MWYNKAKMGQAFWLLTYLFSSEAQLPRVVLITLEKYTSKFVFGSVYVIVVILTQFVSCRLFCWY